MTVVHTDFVSKNIFTRNIKKQTNKKQTKLKEQIDFMKHMLPMELFAC